MFYDTDKYDLLPFYSSCAILMEMLEGETAMGSNGTKITAKDIVAFTAAVGGLTAAVGGLIDLGRKGYCLVKEIDGFKGIRRRKVRVPTIYADGYAITKMHAETMLKSAGLTSVFIPAQLKDASPKYKDYCEFQVIDSKPKVNTKVDLETQILVKYITQEVINASKQLDENQRRLDAQAKFEENLKSPVKAIRLQAQSELHEMRTTK